MQATLIGRRSFGASALAYQWFSHLLASGFGGAVALITLGSILRALDERGEAQLLIANAVAAFSGVVAWFVWTSAITFRSAVLLEAPVFRRVGAALFGGLVVNEALFAAGTLAFEAAGADLGQGVVVSGFAAGAAQFLATFAALHLWGYRVVLPPPPRRVLAGDGWNAGPPTDVELISIAAGERQLTGFWRLRGWVFAYFFVFGVLLGYGWYSTVRLGMANGDGTARVTQAFQVLFSREPHLAALGFVWPPIPAFTDIPLVALLRPLGYVSFAGTVMGALYGAGALVMFAGVLRTLGANRVVTTALTLALGANQFFYQSVAAGLSEPVLAFFLLASLRAYVAWLRDPQPASLMYAGVACAGALMSRYEAALWTGAMAAALMITLYAGVPGLGFLRTPGAASAAEARPRMTSGAWAFLAPTAFALIVWVILNQQIAGSPLYFLTGQGSTRMSPDTAKLAGEGLAAYSPEGLLVFRAYGSVSGLGALFLDRVLFFSPLLLACSAVLVPLAFLRRDYRTIGLLGIVWSITAFALITGFLGSLPPYQRYWYWLGPMGGVLAAYGIAGIRAWGLRVVLWLAVVIVSFAPNVRTFAKTYRAFDAEQPSAEQRLRNALFTSTDLGSVEARSAAVREWQALAAEVNAIPADRAVILDIANPGGPLLLYVDHIERFITSTDLGFDDEVLPEPWLHADYILVPEPVYDVKTRSTVLQQYPGLWEGQRTWAKTVAEVPGPHRWRVMELTPGVRAAGTPRR